MGRHFGRPQALGGPPGLGRRGPAGSAVAGLRCHQGGSMAEAKEFMEFMGLILLYIYMIFMGYLYDIYGKFSRDDKA